VHCDVSDGSVGGTCLFDIKVLLSSFLKVEFVFPVFV
jgi:hypothetical protein